MTWLSLIAVRLGIKGGIIIALCLALAVMWWRADTISEQRDEARATIAEMEAAQVVAERAHLAAKAKAEADYRNLAQRIDTDAQQAHVAAMDAASRYIAANRVRCPAVGGPSGGTAPAPADRDTGVHPELSRDSLVAVADDDVRACSAWVSYGISAREWALELEQRPKQPD